MKKALIMVYAIKCSQPRERKVSVILALFNSSLFKTKEMKKHAHQNGKEERARKKKPNNNRGSILPTFHR